jgi:predicted DCC family thiol-disulfide oxidoreductase YuxK
VKKSALLIYDGDCAFCKQSLRWAIDTLPEFCRYVAFQKVNYSEFGLSESDVRSQVWLVDDSLRLGGQKAVAWLFRQQSHLGWRVIGSVIQIFNPISALVYKWVAKNRHRLPGGTAECVIDDRP